MQYLVLTLRSGSVNLRRRGVGEMCPGRGCYENADMAKVKSGVMGVYVVDTCKRSNSDMYQVYVVPGARNV